MHRLPLVSKLHLETPFPATLLSRLTHLLGWTRLTACLLLGGWSDLAAAEPVQTAEHVVVQSSSQFISLLSHLRIAENIKNDEYRRQLLALTPSGSSYREVRAFVLREWQHEKEKPNPVFKEMMLQLKPVAVTPVFGLHERSTPEWMRLQPPHIKIADLYDPFARQEGRQYMLPIFFRPALPWRKEMLVTVHYVFNAHGELIDVFAFGGVVQGSSW